MKKILALLLALCCIMGLAACSKNTDNLPTLSSITEMEEAAVNELLKGYYRDQLIEVWGEPTSSNDNEEIWVIDDITLTVNTNNNGEVVICGLSKSNDKMNAITFPDELPELTISYGEEEITVWVSGHSWVYEDENGEMNTITADSNHPLHCMETMSFIPIYATTVSHAVGYEPGQVTLNFDVEPTKITVYRYDVEAADETVGEEIIMDNGYVLDLAFGNYLYHIAAEWDYPDKELGGSGDYAFYTKAPEIENSQTE